MRTKHPKSQSTTLPEQTLTHQEWVDYLKEKENIIVSGKFLAKSIEDRIRADEARMIQEEYEMKNISDGTAEPRILFGIKTFLINLIF